MMSLQPQDTTHWAIKKCAVAASRAARVNRRSMQSPRIGGNLWLCFMCLNFKTLSGIAVVCHFFKLSTDVSVVWPWRATYFLYRYVRLCDQIFVLPFCVRATFKVQRNHLCMGQCSLKVKLSKCKTSSTVTDSLWYHAGCAVSASGRPLSLLSSLKCRLE